MLREGREGQVAHEQVVLAQQEAWIPMHLRPVPRLQHLNRHLVPELLGQASDAQALQSFNLSCKDSGDRRWSERYHNAEDAHLSAQPRSARLLLLYQRKSCLLMPSNELASCPSLRLQW